MLRYAIKWLKNVYASVMEIGLVHYHYTVLVTVMKNSSQRFHIPVPLARLWAQRSQMG